MPTRLRFTTLQCHVLDELWRHGPLSVHALSRHLTQTPFLTIRLALRRLERKGVVRRCDPFLFEPTITRSLACESVLDSFGLEDGRARRVIRRLLDTERLTLAEMREVVESAGS